jgi:hypothetical protein
LINIAEVAAPRKNAVSDTRPASSSATLPSAALSASAETIPDM